MWRRLTPLILVVAVAAGAQEPERWIPGAEEALAYRAVGRLNVAGTRFCTATLIAPAIVVTAAHCLYNPRTGARVPLAEFRFVAGLRRGDYAALGRPVRAVTAPGFVYDGIAGFDGVREDLALLELAEAVPEDAAAPFAPGAIGDGRLAIVSYARDRKQMPTIEAPCRIESIFGGVAALDCAVHRGASGAPVLQGEGAEARLVAVVSASGRVLATDADVTLTVLTADRIDALRAALAEAPFEE